MRGKMDKINNVLLQAIFNLIEPNKLLYSGDNIAADRLYESFPCFDIVSLALVSWKWFNNLSKLIDRLELRLYYKETLGRRMKLEKVATAALYRVGRTEKLERDKPNITIDLDHFKSLLDSKFSLLRACNLRQLVIRDVYPWNKRFDSVINNLYNGGQLKSVTVITEIVLLPNFISKHPHKNRFQYYVVPTITNCLKSTDIAASIKYLKQPANNIVWLETIFSNHPDSPLEKGIAMLADIEKAVPLAMTQFSFPHFFSDIPPNDWLQMHQLSNIYKRISNNKILLNENLKGKKSTFLNVNIHLCPLFN
ncbi:hypothetical protein PPL_02966 [Heterostelium album PN500]|uniref:Uncharacterized protein n=1 Tax=Heterostelium pallidum (strain ATCC 26659 / Pp 5 / PN500) TaxID=670386 RepID=D3B3J8_HETP5|nr:hypothetical protein PPL_02966 [Heterostelium album PN500]EFA83896.1 hypothetical protein PPL_02966 [Heterostelium album PN500]|eukprot:XP_020436013.1 hypothetical protein PPL_02966 [Heterostelium album PN500]